MTQGLDTIKQIAPRQTLLDEMRRGSLVLTGNERLSRDIRQVYENSMIREGRAVWESPPVMSWDRWLVETWDDIVLSAMLENPPVLLSSLQENALWEKIITDSRTGEHLLQLHPTIRQVRDAWKLLHEWKLDLSEEKHWHNVDSQAFMDWCNGFRKGLQKRNQVTGAQLPDCLREAFLHNQYVRYEKIILVGFDELTPQQELLIQGLVNKGVFVVWHENQPTEARVRKIALSNAKEEASLAARWTRHCIEENPALRICIVVPELDSQRNLLQQVFDEILCPEMNLPGSENRERPYNISMGLSLARYPLIQTAMLLLSANFRAITIPELGVLLHSPFIEGWQDEYSARALLESRVREDAELCVSVYRLLVYANETGKPYHCPVLARCLNHWKQRMEQLPRRQPVDKWVDVLFQLLQVSGWARGRSLSSHEYQVLEAWNELVPTLASLDTVMGVTGYQHILQELRRLVTDRVFQPRTGETNIQIMGVWETSGLVFDRMWVMGLHDGIWPPTAHPNPFLPLPLQRMKQVPHASANRELEVVARTTARLLGSATEIVVSYPRMSEQEDLRPSPLLAGIEPMDRVLLPAWDGETWMQKIHKSVSLEKLEHDPVPAAEVSRIRGGSRVFRLQALCPFRAFAEIRLAANKPGIPVLGVDAKKRGIMVHQVLERTWSHLKTHERLIALTPQDRSELILGYIDQVIIETERQSPYTFTEKFKSVERERMLALICEWLSIEEKRSPFQVVACEHTINQSVAGIPVRLSIDRVDELADGRKILIDYKTGKVEPAQWFGERPDEPQLPLYATVMEEALAGVSFAQLKQGELGFNGVGVDSSLVEGIKEFKKIRAAESFSTWEELLQEWRRVIEQLGTDFRSGLASVAPKDPNTTCRYCDMEPLCRIFEAPEQATDETDVE